MIEKFCFEFLYSEVVGENVGCDVWRYCCDVKFDVFDVAHRTTATASCTSAPLLAGTESDVQIAVATAPLRVHLNAADRPAPLQYGASSVAATWGGFGDPSSNLGAAQLCIDSVDSSPPTHVCTAVATEGRAVAMLPVDDGATYTVTVTVSDIVGRNATLTSWGTTGWSNFGLIAGSAAEEAL